VTVPASFDAVARELTLQAAERAGYRDVTLLEEPQAAFYAWIERHQDWRERVEVGDLILVVDIGGGTTDFTLIAVTEQNGELGLERMAVGEHILLGGDVAWACRRSDCRTPLTPLSRGTWPSFYGSRQLLASMNASAAVPRDWPRRRTFCSTAACCAQILYANESSVPSTRGWRRRASKPSGP